MIPPRQRPAGPAWAPSNFLKTVCWCREKRMAHGERDARWAETLWIYGLAILCLTGVPACAHEASSGPAASSPQAPRQGSAPGYTPATTNLNLPLVIHMKSAGGHCATWVPNSEALRVISFTPDSVVMDRTDPPNQWFPRGLRFRYVGKLSADGHHINRGTQITTFGMGPGSGPFYAAWGSAIDDVPGDDGPACASWVAGVAHQSVESSPAPQAASPPAQPQPSRPEQPAASATAEQVESFLPKDNVANTAIDNGFKQWSSAWMFDRYLPGSARATDRGFKNGTYVIRGIFDFVRGGARLTIPFAAAFTNSSNGYQLSNLCYNDNTSGTTDCIDPSDRQGVGRAALQSRQFLGSIVLLGLAAAMTSTSETCERHSSIFGTTYYCY